MQIYLPIAELSVNIFLLLALGGITGLLSGMFGVGGGFLLTPLLMFLGIAPPVAVATSANQIVASSISGLVSHMRRHNVDFRMGNFLLAGGILGSTLGVFLFKLLKTLGQIDLIINVCYVVFLGAIGGMMAAESLRELRGAKKKTTTKEDKKGWKDRLPLHTHFPKSDVTVSAILPVTIGFFVGALVSFMGIGGGFFLIPAMIYLLRMPTSVVIGTSLYQILFITANVTLLQALTTQTVDIVLAILLLSGSVLGAQAGTKLGNKLPAEQLRGLLALIVLAVAAKLALDMFIPPENPFSIITDQ